MKKKITGLFLAFVFFSSTAGAVTKYYFYVQLANKNNTPYSLSVPSEYLSARAIARRAAFNVAVDSTDLPVNPSYVSQIAAKGVKIHCRSKWMNGVTVLTSDSALMSQVRALPFVKWAKYTGKIDVLQPVSARRIKQETEVYSYGTATTQINQINGSYLHNQGYTGRNMHVAVLDAGFTNVNINPGFDSLRLQGRLLGTKDFSEPTPNIYASDSHGANVLSIMTGNIANQYLGAAPHASYWLIRTEYAPSEYLSETDFWVSGIEFADSVGVDVVNSSLGYTTFDDPALNFTYANMNGTFSRASRAATLAVQKGIVVCNSAGNDGNKTWHYIGVPADAAGIVTVGAADATGAASAFTSYGPSADGRVKPELTAMGTATAYINTAGALYSGNGTSYSSPLMAGMLTCFLQYAKANFTNFSIESLLNSVKRSANLYLQPGDRLGYGIPNFQTACAFLPAMVEQLKVKDEVVRVFLNEENRLLIANFVSDGGARVSLYDVSGRLIQSTLTSEQQVVFSTAVMKSGVYVLKFSGPDLQKSVKLIIK